MKIIPDEKKQQIINVLQQKGVNRPCPKCNHNNFTLVDGYFNQVIQPELKGITLSGPAVPSVVTVCTNCGYISQHALGVLGLMPADEEKLDESR